MSQEIALITGASSGIGLELAHLFASKGYSLILVAQNREKLDAAANYLKTQYQVPIRVIYKNLSRPESGDEIVNELQGYKVRISVLVNNAGFSNYGKFSEIPVENQINQINTNITTLTKLTRLILPYMIMAKSGKILNVASTAAFQPGPLMAVYYASKAYVLSFSEALASELIGTGVTVTALCPGPTATGFQKRAEMLNSKLMDVGLMDVKDVAKAGFEGLMKGKTVVIPGIRNKIMSFLVRFLPRNLVTRIVKQAQEKKDKVENSKL